MNRLMILNDFKKNKIVNILLLSFIAFCTCLAVLSVVTAERTLTSISDMYSIAQPPHFVQMHKGDIDTSTIEAFTSKYEGLTHSQIVTMIDVYGESLTVKGENTEYDLSDSRLDIGLVKQNTDKDLLLDKNHQKIILKPGEIAMPVIFQNIYDMKIGERIILESDDVKKEFVIKEFALDSMMNSTMSSSTRILLSDADFDSLRENVGEKEYLIETYFTDKNEASAFQSAYENEGLAQNGQAVTYTVIFILSALTDIVTVFVLLLVSLLLFIVSGICIRFTILAALEEEINEIGALKAIGLRTIDITGIYIYKYRILAATGAIAGWIIALMMSGAASRHISATFGNAGLSGISILLSVLTAAIVYLLTVYYCKSQLKKIKNFTVIDAMVNGKSFHKSKKSVKDALHKSKRLPADVLMSIREVTSTFKSWIIVFSSVVICTMLIMIPFDLLGTFKDPEFITYMGSSKEDILIEAENGEDLEESYSKIKTLVENDSEVKSYNEYKRVRLQAEGADEEQVNLHTDTGKSAGVDLKYLSGMHPLRNDEIALSYLNAEKTAKTTGDSISILIEGEKQEFKITGIYQDVTSGGYTAKAFYDFPEAEAEKYIFSVDIDDPHYAEQKADEWTAFLGAGITANPMEEFINQTLGAVTDQLESIVLAAIITGLFITILISVLFLKLHLAKQIHHIAALRVIGFSKKDIKRQYMMKMGMITGFGIILGIILTKAAGERIVSLALAISGLGIKQVELVSNPLISYILFPALILAGILTVTAAAVRKSGDHNMMEVIRRK